jgi:hypothetical protein
MLKQRGEKGGSGGPDLLPLGEGKVGVWRSARHVAGEWGEGDPTDDSAWIRRRLVVVDGCRGIVQGEGLVRNSGL